MMEQTLATELLSNCDNSDVQMPSEDLKEHEDDSIITKDISEAIGGSTVELYLVDKSNEIEIPNFLIDFSNAEKITELQKRAIKGLLISDGNVAIYLCNGKQVIKIGYSDEVKMSSLISTLKNYVFSDGTAIYKNIERGKKPIEIKKRDITKLRMRI